MGRRPLRFPRRDRPVVEPMPVREYRVRWTTGKGYAKLFHVARATPFLAAQETWRLHQHGGIHSPVFVVEDVSTGEITFWDLD